MSSTSRALARYAFIACLLAVGTACLPDAQRVQLDRLFDELVQARVALAQPTPDLAVCDAVTAVDTRLQGEPGLVDIKPAWPRLREATDALLAVCGQAQLLALPFDSTSATLAGRERWQAGVQRELETACTALQAAARALEKSQPC